MEMTENSLARAGWLHRAHRELQLRAAGAIMGEEGMSTAEYAIGTIAAAAFGAVLYGVVTGDNVVSGLTGIINKALNTQV